MSRLALVLAVVLVTSALSLVNSRYEARWTNIELERARQEERALDIAWRQLQIELTEAAQHARIDALARGELGMTPVNPQALLHWRSAVAGGRP